MNEHENRKERARKAMQARKEVEEAALSIYFIPDEAAARALAATVVDEPAEWMFFGSRVELEDLEFGLDRRLRRVPLDTDVFVFLNQILDAGDMHDWVRPAVFDAVTRLHACGRKLHLAVLADNARPPRFEHGDLPMSEQEERDAELRAKLAWRRIDRLVSRTLFAKDEAEVRKLYDGVDAHWMEFKSQAEFESLGDGGFDRQMRRLPLGVSIFVFCNFTLDSDPTLWLEPAVFGATLRLHAFGGKLYMVWIDSDQTWHQHGEAIAQEKAKSLPPKDPDHPPF
jgi:hypothetical protein